MSNSIDSENLKKQNIIINNYINLLESLTLWSNENGYGIINSISNKNFYNFCNEYTLNQINLNKNIDNLNLGYIDFIDDIKNNDDYYESKYFLYKKNNIEKNNNFIIIIIL